MENYISLHVHSIGSLRDGIMRIADIAKSYKERNKKYISITDHGSISEWIELYNESKKNNLKPIFGIEGYIVNNREEFLTKKSDKPDHIILLAKNKIGFKNIIKIHNDAWQHFYKKPIMDYDFLFDNNEGIFVGSACMGGTLPKSLFNKDIDKANQFINKMKEVFKDRFFIELMLINMYEQIEINKLLIEFAKKYKIKTVITTDAHYLKPEDKDIHQVSLLLQSNKTIKDLNDNKAWKFSVDDLFLKDVEDLKNTFNKFYKSDKIFTKKVFDDSLKNVEFYTEQIETFSLEHPPRLPHFMKGYKTLKKLVVDNFEKKLENGIIPLEKANIYLDRLKYELKTIKDLEMVDYILLIHDMVNWCKENEIYTGPGRGSASASLVNYLIGITKLDPIKFNLIFERFLNPARKTKLQIL